MIYKKGNSYMDEMMRLERMKAIIRAIAELEITLNTFYGDSEDFERIRAVYNDLINLKEDYLDKR